MRKWVPLLASLLVACGAGCVADVGDDAGERSAEVDSETVATATDALTIPSGIAVIKHWYRPADPDAISLTFDDGPDTGTSTNRILDTLKRENIKATFFINSRVDVDIRYSASAKATIRRILAEGHQLGNHTANHYDLGKSSTAVDTQLTRLETDLKYAVPEAPRPTLIRAPYGQPYLSGTQERLNYVAKVVARHGVHIGWSIDSLDWQCQGEGASCVREVTKRVLYRIDLDRRGIILFHDTVKETADALPGIITEIRKRGLKFVTVEQLVRAKYGKSSYTLTQEYRNR